ncbi:MAG: 2-C-methyl-D-erythritol 4-phosphate cytidylyltransferase [Mediterranea sp.]|jgi:2-C-methyl-D-erythritol 4-phosphate cytidylyltransferase|nr:2-C-methyl-D-erythritol 4-phosphate cytidylyltransferase [Mediterranea sp.]
MNRYALIVAGGKGLRMGSKLPKQFLPIGTKAVLMYAIEAFYAYDPDIKIMLVLPEEQQSLWQQLCEEAHFAIAHTVVLGGETRYQSVKNGLAQITEGGLVGVHDGVRPLVSSAVIARCYQEAEVKKAVVPVIDIVETVRRVNNGKSETVNRNDYKLVQTPQVFDIDLLKRAYSQDFIPSFTDDASVVEAMNVSVYLTEGNRENIKITTPLDIKIAETFLLCST